MKKLTALWLSLLLAFGTLTGCAGQIGIIGGEDGPTASSPQTALPLFPSPRMGSTTARTRFPPI